MGWGLWHGAGRSGTRLNNLKTNTFYKTGLTTDDGINLSKGKRKQEKV